MSEELLFSPWIKTSERLPENEIKVIGRREFTSSAYDTPKYFHEIYYYADQEWHDNEGVYPAPKYWMYIPE
jgi:hypothetical protein